MRYGEVEQIGGWIRNMRKRKVVVVVGGRGWREGGRRERRLLICIAATGTVHIVFPHV